MYAIFWLTFTVGEVPMGWIESGFDSLAAGISTLWPTESALKSLVVDGVINAGGLVGAKLEFKGQNKKDRNGENKVDKNGYEVLTHEVDDGAGWGSWRAHTDRILESFFPLED